MAKESKVEYLKNMVASMFENATTKETIDTYGKLQQAVEEVEKEQNELFKQNAELISDYKEVVKHTSFKEPPKAKETQSKGGSSMEEILDKVLSSNDKNLVIK